MSGPVVQQALAYAARGWSVFPVHSIKHGQCTCSNKSTCSRPGKHPRTEKGLLEATTDYKVIQNWGDTWANSNIGIRMGSGFGFFAIDIDPRHEGDKTLADLESIHGKLPESFTVQTGGHEDGKHYYFKYPGFKVKSKTYFQGIDIKGDGGYVVGAGSLHISGRHYTILKDVPVSDAPQWLIERLRAESEGQQKAQNNESSSDTDIIQEGQRKTTLMSLAGSMRRRGMTESEISAALHVINAKRCSPPLPTHEVDDVAKSVGKYTPSGPIVLTKFYPRPFTEKVLADRDFIYGGTKDYLYHCDPQNNLWRTDGEDFIRYYFRTTTDGIEDALKKSHIIEEIVADIQGITYKPESLPEPDVNLIPCLNGVYDISTDKFRPFRKDDYFTWTLPWNYNENSHCVYLKKLLNDTLPDPSFLWDLLAYCLYRGYPLQKFFMLIGRGRNGKGVYQTILTRLLGCMNVSNISLSDFETNRFSASALYRCLANISSEENYGDLQNTRVLKMLTGGDQVQADRKFKRSVKFVNYAKIILSTNQVAKTRDTTDAFFRRVAIQEFPYQFKIDPAIDIRIREESPEMTLEFEGLLFLALQGLMTLKANNFIFAGAHDFDATRARYQSLSNPLMQFLEEEAERSYDANNYVFKFEFLDKLNIWLQEHGFNSYLSNRLGREMKELGFEEGRRNYNEGKRFFAWIGLRWKAKSSKNVKDGKEVKAFSNNSQESIRTVVKCLDFPDNPDTTFEQPPILDGE